MKRTYSIILQAATVLLGLVVATLLLWEPHLEGRNANATPFEIYFHDPFLAYVYVGSLPFFFGLYRAFGMFGHAGRTGAFSAVTVDALRTIQRCALAVIFFVVGALVLILVHGDGEDRPAGLFMGLLVILPAAAVATITAALARKLATTLSQPKAPSAQPE